MAYELVERVPEVDDFIYIRKAAGVSPRSRQAVEKGLPNTLYGVTVYRDGKAVGMGRIVGDGGCSYEIIDIAVVPEHQGKGLGTRIMTALMNHLRENAVATAYVSLIADVPGFYERFGFRLVRPRAEGMELRI